MARPLLSWDGWRRLLRSRRMSHRAAGLGIYLAEATRLATHECRVRAELATIVGKPAAMDIRLTACDGASGPQFVLTDPTDHALWQRFREVEGLLRPVSTHP